MKLVKFFLHPFGLNLEVSSWDEMRVIVLLLWMVNLHEYYSVHWQSINHCSFSVYFLTDVVLINSFYPLKNQHK